MSDSELQSRRYGLFYTDTGPVYKEFDENVPKRLDTAIQAKIRFDEESQNWKCV